MCVYLTPCILWACTPSFCKYFMGVRLISVRITGVSHSHHLVKHINKYLSLTFTTGRIQPFYSVAPHGLNHRLEQPFLTLQDETGIG